MRVRVRVRVSYGLELLRSPLLRRLARRRRRLAVTHLMRFGVSVRVRVRVSVWVRVRIRVRVRGTD